VTGLLLALALAADPRARLGEVEARREAEAAAARLLAEKEASVLTALEVAEAAVRGAERELARAEEARGAAEQRLERARADEAAAQRRYRERIAELRPRLAARARLGRAGTLGLLLSAPSFPELVKRRYLLDAILSRDATLTREAREALEAGERARAARHLEATRLAEAEASARDRRAATRARRAERSALLTALRSARALHERAAAEAAEQAVALAGFVATLPPRQAAGSRGGAFRALKGKLPLPSPGPVSVPFGKVVNPRFNTVTVQNGLDVEAPAGAPVRAVAGGRVVHAGWFRGYGNLVIVDHGDGYHTLVAHLAAMRTATGEEVRAGDELGTVGDSGSLKGAYLYFELREKGRPVDPGPWLAP
jgi:septal ring factor EnvC (AmiA/AmiB activator)